MEPDKLTFVTKRRISACFAAHNENLGRTLRELSGVRTSNINNLLAFVEAAGPTTAYRSACILAHTTTVDTVVVASQDLNMPEALEWLKIICKGDVEKNSDMPLAAVIKTFRADYRASTVYCSEQKGPNVSSQRGFWFEFFLVSVGARSDTWECHLGVVRMSKYRSSQVQTSYLGKMGDDP